MPFIFAVIGFITGYLFAVFRRTWADWVKTTQALKALSSQRWADLKAVAGAGAVALILLYLAAMGRL